MSKTYVAVCQDCRWEGPEQTPDNVRGRQVKVCPECDSDDVDYFARTTDEETLGREGA